MTQITITNSESIGRNKFQNIAELMHFLLEKYPMIPLLEIDFDALPELSQKKIIESEQKGMIDFYNFQG